MDPIRKLGALGSNTSRERLFHTESFGFFWTTARIEYQNGCLTPPSIGKQSLLYGRTWFSLCPQQAILTYYSCFWKKLSSAIRSAVNLDVLYCTMLGFLNQFWSPVVPCYATEDTVRVVNSFITIPITRNYSHSQLFLTLLHMYTAYNHLFHSYTFTQFTCTTLYLYCTTAHKVS
jgi:hypothetical protein